LFCPWNKFAVQSGESDFAPRHDLDNAELTTLFRWDKATWQAKTEGSAMRRIGYEQWQRNLAVALGNAQTSDEVLRALSEKTNSDSALVREHVNWALQQHDHPASPNKE
jgi:epoxyqueuosine reductase